jgi:hypothetical protein
VHVQFQAVQIGVHALDAVVDDVHVVLFHYVLDFVDAFL